MIENVYLVRVKLDMSPLFCSDWLWTRSGRYGQTSGETQRDQQLPSFCDQRAETVQSCFVTTLWISSELATYLSTQIHTHRHTYTQTILSHYCRTHNVRVCLYIACGSASLYIKTLYFFFTELVLSAVATVTNIKKRYDAKTPQFAIFGTRIVCVFYSISTHSCLFYWIQIFSDKLFIIK